MRLRILVGLLAVVSLIAAACGGTETVTETVVVTSVVEVEVPGETITETVTSIVTEVVPGQTITFWSTETQPARAERTQAIIDRFTAASGIGVELVLVDANNISSIMAANQAAGTLPDVVFHPLEYTFGWYNDGVLDAAAASAVVDALGADTFSEGALGLATIDGSAVTVPTWQIWVTTILSRNRTRSSSRSSASRWATPS